MRIRLVERPSGFTALVIGPGGGRDLLSALVFGATRVDGVEINPIIVRDVMQGRFREYSGNLYGDPRVSIHVDDGRSFVRRTANRYDVIQASLVDTWAATAAGAYTLTENSLYTAEAFGEYLDHLTDDGVLTITRWVFDGLRLVSLAQEACAARGLDPARHLAIIRHDRVATFLLKKRPFTPDDVERLTTHARTMGFEVLYAPGVDGATGSADPREMVQSRTSAADYARFILATDRNRFIEEYPLDIRPTTDDRPFFFHTTRLADQFDVAFGKSMLFGNGLSALLTLFGISATLVVLFVVGPLHPRRREAWRRLGTVARVLRRARRRVHAARGRAAAAFRAAAWTSGLFAHGDPVLSASGNRPGQLSEPCHRRPERPPGHLVGPGRDRGRRAGDAICHSMGGERSDPVDSCRPDCRWPSRSWSPIGILLGMALPGGMRLLAARRPDIVPWGWGMNGALSVVGATLAVFIAMNWGFSTTFLAAAVVYTVAAVVFPK